MSGDWGWGKEIMDICMSLPVQKAIWRLLPDVFRKHFLRTTSHLPRSDTQGLESLNGVSSIYFFETLVPSRKKKRALAEESWEKRGGPWAVLGPGEKQAGCLVQELLGALFIVSFLRGTRVLQNVLHMEHGLLSQHRSV